MEDILKLIAALFLVVFTSLLSLFNRVITGFAYTLGFLAAMEVIGGLLK